MPSSRELYQRNFAKENFQAGPRIMTIKEVTVEVFKSKGPDKPDEKKLVLRFLEDERGCVCSKTRAEAVETITGTDDYTKWAGTKIELFYDPTIRNPNGGKGGIGIRKPSAA
jgi:hypothetical protein